MKHVENEVSGVLSQLKGKYDAAGHFILLAFFIFSMAVVLSPLLIWFFSDSDFNWMWAVIFIAWYMALKTFVEIKTGRKI